MPGERKVAMHDILMWVMWVLASMFLGWMAILLKVDRRFSRLQLIVLFVWAIVVIFLMNVNSLSESPPNFSNTVEAVVFVFIVLSILYFAPEIRSFKKKLIG